MTRQQIIEELRKHGSSPMFTILDRETGFMLLAAAKLLETDAEEMRRLQARLSATTAAISRLNSREE